MIQRVEGGDIPAAELIIAGEVAATEEGRRLKELGVTMLPGVRAAATEALSEEFAAVHPNRVRKRKSL